MTEPRITAEQCRFHAAGHLAAAVALIDAGNANAAKVVLQIVEAYAKAESVTTPPPVMEMIEGAISDPANSRGAVVTLERIFIDPANSAFEGRARG